MAILRGATIEDGRGCDGGTPFMLMLLVARAGNSSACYLSCTAIWEMSKGLLSQLAYMIRVNGKLASVSVPRITMWLASD